MKTIKAVFLGIITLAALTIAVQGQTRYVNETVWGGAGTLINAAFTTNLNLTIDCRKAEYVSLQLSMSHTAAGTDAQTVVLQKSNDGTTWATSADTQGYVSWIITPAGATPVSYITNITMGGVGYLRLTSIANGHATLLSSNVTVTASRKISVGD